MIQDNFKSWLKQRRMEPADASLEARIIAQAKVTTQQAANTRWWKRVPQPVYGVMALMLVAVFFTWGQPKSSVSVEGDEALITDVQLLAEIFYYDEDTLF